MNLQPLTTAELLIKEMSEIRANQLAKSLIEERKDVDAANNIAFVIAKVLPLVKPADLQQQVYQLLVESSATHTATQNQLAATVLRVQELTKQIEELQANQLEAEEFKDITQQDPKEQIQQIAEIEHEPS